MAEELRPGVGTNVSDLPGQRFATRSSVRDMGRRALLFAVVVMFLSCACARYMMLCSNMENHGGGKGVLCRLCHRHLCVGREAVIAWKWLLV